MSESNRILIVDDSPDEAGSLRTDLEAHGFAVEITPDGETALALIRERPPRAVISDIVIPGLGGFDLCQELKADPELREIPVVLLTGLSEPSDVLRGLAVGADLYLARPHDKNVLLSRLTSLLDAGSADSAEERPQEVLVVEDNPDQALMLSAMLRTKGYGVLVAEDGKEALSILQEHQPDLVVSDVMMPEMDGYDLCLSIKADPKLRGIPVILVTSLSKPDDVVRAIEVGADHYFIKPYDGEELISQLEALSVSAARGVEEGELEITFEGQQYVIKSERNRILSLLLATYENSVQQNQELDRTRKQLEKTAARLEERVEERTAELADTIAKLNGEITERIKTEQAQRSLEEQLRQAQKMEAVGQLAGGMAHDLNNHLTVVVANSEMFASTLEPGSDDWQALQEVLAAARRGTRLVNSLLAFCRRGDLTFDTLDPAALLKGLEPMLRSLIPESIDIRFDLGEKTPTIVADPGAVEQILLNLATNARDAMPAGGELRFSLSTARFSDTDIALHGWASPGEYVCFTTSDTGTGMSAETLARVFEPFYTTKRRGFGTGLGMAMSYGLVAQHGGFIHPSSEPDKGTTFRIYLPVAELTETHGEQRQEADRAPPLTHGDETILLVEDDEALRRATRRVLESLGYSVILADDGEEGLTVLQERHEEIALVISDLIMPKLGGLGLREAVRTELEDTVHFLFVTGYGRQEVQDMDGFGPDTALLHKPWTVEALAAKVREQIDGAEA